MIHPSIEVRVSTIAGRGLFAKGFITKGEIVWKQDAHEKSYPVSEISQWPDEVQKYFYSLAWQTGPEMYSGPTHEGESDPGDYTLVNPTADLRAIPKWSPFGIFNPVKKLCMIT